MVELIVQNALKEFNPEVHSAASMEMALTYIKFRLAQGKKVREIRSLKHHSGFNKETDEKERLKGFASF